MVTVDGIEFENLKAVEQYIKSKCPEKAKRNKYGAQKVELDGYTFDSKAEATRYCELKMLHQAGVICALLVHPTFVLLEPFTYRGKKIRGITYTADFQYHEFLPPGCEVVHIVEDVKGNKATQTQAFKIKEKLFKHRYPYIDFRIVER